MDITQQLYFLTGLVLGPYDFTFLLILQLSCVLHMVPFWETRSKLRVMQIVESDGMNYIKSWKLEFKNALLSDAIIFSSVPPSSPLGEIGPSDAISNNYRKRFHLGPSNAISNNYRQRFHFFIF